VTVNAGLLFVMLKLHGFVVPEHPVMFEAALHATKKDEPLACATRVPVASLLLNEIDEHVAEIVADETLEFVPPQATGTLKVSGCAPDVVSIVTEPSPAPANVSVNCRAAAT
jgi:hypothetical protein